MAILLDELVGWWKLGDVWHECKTEPRNNPFGGWPTGSLVFTDDRRMMLVILGSTSTAHAPSYDFEAHSGRFVLDGSAIITTIEFSSRVQWMHEELKYCVSLGHNGRSLCLTSRQTGPLYDGAPFISASNWFRMR
ncbi:hypothetical protein [Bradyrhizobium sp. USDA 4353]